jgi:hypothetical protein
MLKIDKGIPIPKKNSSGRPKNQGVHDALSLMETGDSVEFPVDAISNGTPYSKDGNTFRQLARLRGMKMTQRVNEDKSAIRFWRVK